MKLTNKTKVFISIVALALIITSVILSLRSTTKPSKVARSFLEDLSKKEIEEAYNMTSTQFKATVTKETFNNFLNLYPILTSRTEIDFSEHSVDNDIATISGKIKARDGSNFPITMHIIKENGNWRVLALSLNPSGSSRGIAMEEKNQ